VHTNASAQPASTVPHNLPRENSTQTLQQLVVLNLDSLDMLIRFMSNVVYHVTHLAIRRRIIAQGLCQLPIEGISRKRFRENVTLTYYRAPEL
jgi:hypothetical protein